MNIGTADRPGIGTSGAGACDKRDCARSAGKFHLSLGVGRRGQGQQSAAHGRGPPPLSRRGAVGCVWISYLGDGRECVLDEHPELGREPVPGRDVEAGMELVG